MFGAIYGDIIGSYYELHCTKKYDFPFEKSSCFTDASVLIAAVCEAILSDPSDIGRFDVRKRAYCYAVEYKQFYSFFPNAGFGNMFSDWAKSHSIYTVRSYGNGASMRVIPIGYAYDTIEQTLLQAEASCLYTHRHREAVNGAQAVRGAVSLGGDADTQACIAGGIAEAFYGEIPEHIRRFCDMKIDNTIKKVVKEFNKKYMPSK